MADIKKKTRKKPEDPYELVLAILSTLLLGGMFVYYMYNPWLTAIATALLFFLFAYFFKKPGYEAPQERVKVIEKIMLSAVFIFLIARFYRILTYHADFHGDEWNEIVEAYYKLKGDRGFFDYSRRSGTSLPYVSEAVFAAYFMVFKEHIEFLRTIPLLQVVAGTYGFYLLGNTLRDRSFGITLAFLYASAGWTFFTARELMVIVYIPFLAVFALFFFFKYLKDKHTAWLAACGAVFTAGFFTYTAWVIMVPFMAYLVFEYRKEIKKQDLVSAAAFIIIIVVAAASMYFKYRNIIAWAASQTVLEKSNMIAKLLWNLRQVPVFFILPVENSQWFTKYFPILGFMEYFFLIGGAALAIKNIKDRQHRVFLAGFAMSLFTLLISNGIGHHLRHIFILPFMVVLMGIFLQYLLKMRWAYIFILIQVLLSTNLVFYLFNAWQPQVQATSIDKSLGMYINETYRSGGYIFIHETMPYGNYPAYLRTGSAFREVKKEGVRTIFFSMPLAYTKDVKRAFPGVKTGYFYDYEGTLRYPLALFALDVSGDPALKDYFFSLERALREINIELWCLDYSGCAAACGRALLETRNDPRKLFWNTCMKLYIYECYGRQSKDAERVMMDGAHRSFINP